MPRILGKGDLNVSDCFLFFRPFVSGGEGGKEDVTGLWSGARRVRRCQ